MDVQIGYLIAMAFGIGVVLITLGAIGRREWVKTELRDRGCEPVSISWVPIAFWANWSGGPAFKVAYVDPDGNLHSARCWTSNASWRKMVWERDEIVGMAPRQP